MRRDGRYVANVAMAAFTQKQSCEILSSPPFRFLTLTNICSLTSRPQTLKILADFMGLCICNILHNPTISVYLLAPNVRYSAFYPNSKYEFTLLVAVKFFHCLVMPVVYKLYSWMLTFLTNITQKL